LLNYPMYCSWIHCVLCFFGSSLWGDSEQANTWSFTCWPNTLGLASLFTYFSCQYKQHAFSCRTQGYFCCVKICFDFSLDDYVSINGNVFVIVVSVHNYSFLKTFS